MRKHLFLTLGWLLLALIVLAISGVLLADYLTPRATGEPSHTLPIEAGQTPIDRELEPLLARQPEGYSAAIMLTEGLDAFAARAISARQAGRSLDVQYYIWKDDITGHLLLKELWEAAERGVRVRLLFDDINTSGKDGALLAMSQHENIQVRVYNPFRNRDGIGRLLEMVQRIWSVNHRMHNKAWIADDRMVVLGGRNVGVEYFDAATTTNFRDLDLLLFGPVTSAASAIFDDFWNSPAAVPIDALNHKEVGRLSEVMEQIRSEAQSDEARKYLERVGLSPQVIRYFAQELTPFWSDRYHILSDPPLKHADSNREEWLYRHITRDLASATQSAYIISPYFVPDHDSMQDMFATLTERQAKVGIVTNSMTANDVLAVHSGYMQYRQPLLEKGFELFEIRSRPGSDSSLFGSSGASLHTKAYLLDGARGFIGSFNMDSRSINLNTEMGVAFDNPQLYEALLDEYRLLSGPRYSYAVRLDEHGQLRWHERSIPDEIHTHEPKSTWRQRLFVRVLSWLPIESQL
ncbi:phospholipase D family protein [Corticibacter populi]|uniref:Phospholipase D family protein n=1 Tax=Corticibacter populi TaxID=1550736 RepID=A0A3M6QYD6_9BURK|nr:phospholipase D family protein [Corticibacter populi]RMX08027.1 phospholipase D family protein [Corticibacter populi]RZS35271.1 putative cardiolipin synthase [Corticibacter populi]